MKRAILGSIIAATLVLSGVSSVMAARGNTRDTNNFTITNYDVRLELGRDRDNRSILKTTETITADFPPDQNHGITRQFVKKYDGHATNFTLGSVKDEHGVDLEYHQNGNTLRVGNKNAYVSGTKTYVITYTQRDVTRYYSGYAKRRILLECNRSRLSRTSSVGNSDAQTGHSACWQSKNKHTVLLWGVASKKYVRVDSFGLGVFAARE